MVNDKGLKMIVAKTKRQIREESKTDIAEFLKTGTIKVVESKQLSRRLQRRWMTK